MDSTFWNRVKRGPQCWEWQGVKSRLGYGKLSRHLAHRISWQLAHGAIAEGMCVLHKCDNRACVNPAHLFLGTQSDNMADMVRKGRSTYGERNPQAKLNRRKVNEVRGLRKLGHTYNYIAQKYDMSISRIACICTEKGWL